MKQNRSPSNLARNLISTRWQYNNKELGNLDNNKKRNKQET